MYAKHMVPRPPAKFACEKQLIRPASLSRQFAHRNNALSSCVDIFARRPTDSICDCLAFQFANIKGALSTSGEVREEAMRCLSAFVCAHYEMHYGERLPKGDSNCEPRFVPSRQGGERMHGCV